MKKVKVLPETLYTFQASQEIIDFAFEWCEKTNLTFGGWDHPETKLKGIMSNGEISNKLTDWLDKCLHKVKLDLELNCEFLKSTQLWVNRSGPGVWQGVHTHPNSWASGIFYVTASGCQTWFSRKTMWSNEYTDTICMENRLFDTGIIHKFQTAPGTLVIFPSPLHHSVNEHDLEEPRYSVAFNAFPCGHIGNPAELSYLYIHPDRSFVPPNPNS